MKIYATFLCRVLFLTTVSLLPLAARAAGVVTDCQNFGAVGTPGTLADAINGGGIVTFSCTSGSGTIIVPQTNVNTALGGNLTIDATSSATPITLDGNNTNRHFFVTNSRTLILRRLTLQNGSITGAGVQGGSIYVPAGNLSVDGCLFRNNAASGTGTMRGGAISVETTTLPVTIENCTFENNSVTSVGGFAEGGGLYFSKPDVNTLTVRNCTFRGNSATSGNSAIGGAIFGAANIGAQLDHVTVTNNSVNGPSTAGGGVFAFGGFFLMHRCLIAGNTSGAGTAQDFRTSGAVVTATWNLIGNGNNSGYAFDATNMVGTTASPLDPQLAPLGNYGGPTQTRLPLLNSPVNNAVPAADCALTTDQRGAARTSGQPCTMGAVEPDWALAAIGGTPQSATVNTAFAAPLQVRLADQLDQRLSGIAIVFTAPLSGASANLGAPSANTDGSGEAQVTAAANGTAGGYQVTAATTGATSASFDLTNLPLAANLAITKTDGVATATPGQSVTYTITASNPAGPDAVTAGSVTDSFPSSLTCTWTCAGLNGGTCTAAGSGNIADPVALPSGGSVTYTANCTISSSATGSLVNTANASGGGVGDPDTGDNSATDTDTLAPQADLSITKTDGTATATAGGSVTYTITASNAGPSDAIDATVNDTFPASLTCTWTCAGLNGGSCTTGGSGNIADTVDLPSGGSVTYTANCAVSPSATGSLANTATIPGAVFNDPNTANDSAIDTDTLTTEADLSITKTDGTTTATPGGAVTYTIVASNAGPSDVIGATVSDTFPASLTCTWTCAGLNGGACTGAGSGNIADTVDLPLGASVTYTANCAISPSATGSLANIATIPGAAFNDPNTSNNSATDTDTLSGQTNLSITKTDGTTTAAPGGSLTYTIVGSNAGPSDAVGAAVNDTFPASVTCTWTCAGLNGGTCSASGSGNIADTVNLPSGGNVTYTANCALSPSATGSLVNTATVSAAGDPDTSDNTATDTDTLVPDADLSITKTDGTTTATAGGSVTYTIVTSNAGPSDAIGATVNDTFPASLACTWTCAGLNGGTCTANGSGNIADTVNLPSGGSVTYTASCTISPSATGSLVNTATVSAAGDPNTSNNSATDTDTLTAEADLSVTKTDGATAATPGGSVTYTIVASNAGPSDATGAAVDDTFPASLTCTWTCAGLNGGTCTANGSGNIADSVNLPFGGSVTYTANCTISPSAAGALVNTATVSAGGDPDTSNNSATDTDTLTPNADLSITKSDGTSTATAGGSVTYTIVASNAGPSGATGAAVNDTFPASLTCTWTCAGVGGGTCTANGSGNIADTVDLPLGGGVTYTANCTIAPSATGALSNTATIVSASDPDTSNNAATDTDTLVAPTGSPLSGTKTATGPFTVGSTVVYSITLTNSGPGAQADNPGDELTDVLPPQLALVSATATSGTADANTSTNTVTWNGSIPFPGSVTITITATILPTPIGQTVANQGVLSFDADGNGTNESTALTDDPGAPGGGSPTSFVVAASHLAIPTIPVHGLLLLMFTLACLGLAMLRRLT